jgi:para-nitrobenzyl esterase
MTSPITESPVVMIAQGTLRGVWRGASAAFLGVPFAEAPVGALRWSAPRPAGAWGGVWDATQFGATPQRRGFEAAAIPEPSYPGDATLNLNVFTPLPDSDAALPVLVWIHGGGFKAGSPNSPWYDGRAFNRDGVVTVSVSYRLGFDGFAVIDGCPSNRGLLDMICALEWVRDNIAAFGGDPGRVTIGGQSAGGGAVLALLASPLAQGLFHAAIAHSSAAELGSLHDARDVTREVAALAGVEPTASGFAALREGTLLDLQEALEAAAAVPPAGPQALVDAFASGGFLNLAFRPVLDGEALPQGIPDALASRRGSVPLLIGTTWHEFDMIGAMFAPLFAGVEVDAVLRASVVGDLADELVGEMAGLPAAVVAGHVMTLGTFRVPTVRVGAAHQGPTWLYDFRYRGVQPDGTRGLAGHCSELPFTFDCLDVEPRYVAAADGVRPPAELSIRMHGDWVRFVTGHDASWTPWVPGGEAMIYDEASAAAPGYVLEQKLASRLAR